jgi:hypothetical protein
MKLFNRMMILLAAGMTLTAAVGCASGVASALPPESAPTTAFFQSTATPGITAASQPKPAAQTTAAPSESQPVQSITIAPQEMPARATIKSLVLLSNWQMGLLFEFEQPISDAYSLKFDHIDIQYDCAPRLAYNQPQRLFCSGRQPAMLETVSFTLVKQADDKKVFQGSVFIPAR